LVDTGHLVVSLRFEEKLLITKKTVRGFKKNPTFGVFPKPCLTEHTSFLDMPTKKQFMKRFFSIKAEDSNTQMQGRSSHKIWLFLKLKEKRMKIPLPSILK
jgi:hypothetical protein